MSTTPRTDKAAFERNWDGLVEHARELENELASVTANYEHLSEVTIELRSDLARVTDALGRPAEEPNANGSAYARINWWKQMHDDVNEQLARVTAERDSGAGKATPEHTWKQWADEHIAENAALRARVDEQEATISELTTDGNAATLAENLAMVSKRNAELVAALRDLLKCPTVTDRATCPNGDTSQIDEAPEWQAVLQISCAWTRYKKLEALARAEGSATPATKPCPHCGSTLLWSEDRGAHCDGCDEFDPEKDLHATPAKHSDTEDDYGHDEPLGATFARAELRAIHSARKQEGGAND